MQASGKWEIEGLDWSANIGPYWLVAEHDGDPVGCIQVCPGIPVGRLEFLSVPVDLSKRIKAMAVKRLLDAGRTTLKLAGSQMITGILHEGLEGYQRVLERHYHAVKWFDHGTCFLVRA